jgi:hypothetical protein
MDVTFRMFNPGCMSFNPESSGSSLQAHTNTTTKQFFFYFPEFIFTSRKNCTQIEEVS